MDAHFLDRAFHAIGCPERLLNGTSRIQRLAPITERIGPETGAGRLSIEHYCLKWIAAADRRVIFVIADFAHSLAALAISVFRACSRREVW